MFYDVKQNSYKPFISLTENYAYADIRNCILTNIGIVALDEEVIYERNGKNIRWLTLDDIS